MASFNFSFLQQGRHLFFCFTYGDLRLHFNISRKKKEQLDGKNPSLDYFSLNTNRTN